MVPTMSRVIRNPPSQLPARDFIDQSRSPTATSAVCDDFLALRTRSISMCPWSWRVIEESLPDFDEVRAHLLDHGVHVKREAVTLAQRRRRWRAEPPLPSLALGTCGAARRETRLRIRGPRRLCPSGDLDQVHDEEGVTVMADLKGKYARDLVHRQRRAGRSGPAAKGARGRWRRASALCSARGRRDPRSQRLRQGGHAPRSTRPSRTRAPTDDDAPPAAWGGVGNPDTLRTDEDGVGFCVRSSSTRASRLAGDLSCAVDVR